MTLVSSSTRILQLVLLLSSFVQGLRVPRDRETQSDSPRGVSNKHNDAGFLRQRQLMKDKSKSMSKKGKTATSFQQASPNSFVNGGTSINPNSNNNNNNNNANIQFHNNNNNNNQATDRVEDDGFHGNDNGKVLEPGACIDFQDVSIARAASRFSDDACLTNSCNSGCCRNYHYLICDQSNEFSWLQCVCNSNTAEKPTVVDDPVHSPNNQNQNNNNININSGNTPSTTDNTGAGNQNNNVNNNGNQPNTNTGTISDININQSPNTDNGQNNQEQPQHIGQVVDMTPDTSSQNNNGQNTNTNPSPNTNQNSNSQVTFTNVNPAPNTNANTADTGFNPNNGQDDSQTDRDTDADTTTTTTTTTPTVLQPWQTCSNGSTYHRPELASSAQKCWSAADCGTNNGNTNKNAKGECCIKNFCLCGLPQDADRDCVPAGP